ncbi:MAG: pyridoxal phosphate-dependent aminotransferase, partial [Brevinema sp.]
MIFAHLTEKLTISYLLEKKRMMNKAIEEGKKVIDLSIAEPDFDPPYQIIEAFERVLRDRSHHKYTQTSGIPVLRERFANWATEHYGFNISYNNISSTSGARGGITCLMQALLNPHDEVILPAPYWSGYPNIIKLVGAIPKLVHLDENDGFHPTVELLDKAYNSKTKMIILNNPHNPTGVVWDKETLSMILTWAEQKNIFVVVDEVCMTDIFDGTPFHPMAKVRGSLKNLAVVRSFSKTI